MKLSAADYTHRTMLGALLLGSLSAVQGQNWADMSSSTVSSGDGTFYGQQSGQDDNGICAFGKSFGNTLGLPWSSDIQNTVAMNQAQFSNAKACGLCIMYRGTGSGIGTKPVATTWTKGLVSNVCPECGYGAIDLNSNGDGRWKIEWYPVTCNVGSSNLHYSIFAGANPYWMMFSISNTRVPVASVEAQIGGSWQSLSRSTNNNWPINGQYSFPVQLRITSMLNDTVTDSLKSSSGGEGTSQFPDHGSGTRSSGGQAPSSSTGLPAPPATLSSPAPAPSQGTSQSAKGSNAPSPPPPPPPSSSSSGASFG